MKVALLDRHRTLKASSIHCTGGSIGTHCLRLLHVLFYKLKLPCCCGFTMNYEEATETKHNELVHCAVYHHFLGGHLETTFCTAAFFAEHAASLEASLETFKAITSSALHLVPA